MEGYGEAIRDTQRQLAEDQIRTCQDCTRVWQEFAEWVQATPEYQEQEARRRDITELQSLGEYEAAALVSGL